MAASSKASWPQSEEPPRGGRGEGGDDRAPVGRGGGKEERGEEGGGDGGAARGSRDHPRAERPPRGRVAGTPQGRLGATVGLPRAATAAEPPTGEPPRPLGPQTRTGQEEEGQGSVREGAEWTGGDEEGAPWWRAAPPGAGARGARPPAGEGWEGARRGEGLPKKLQDLTGRAPQAEAQDQSDQDPPSGPRLQRTREPEKPPQEKRPWQRGSRVKAVQLWTDACSAGFKYASTPLKRDLKDPQDRKARTRTPAAAAKTAAAPEGKPTGL